ncbi:TetR/AcrR family transcriptional regulator [Nocardiopsis sp. Huas11]|uniref:TetR/AcrR family transcriptional regulator n=1 Tax=Nocardiopsis sp. Huas11 TaxID=2183912 RepID=UPI000EAB912B|nr:helix-turn-helix domain-containing protein [Nocardiopsis sp. Huas11]
MLIATVKGGAAAPAAERGYTGATIKGIAEAAGVSIGLVQHHFGTKEDLRRACDAYAAETLGSLGGLGVTDGEITDPGFLAGVFQHSPLILRYVARHSRRLPVGRVFDNGAAVAEAFLSQTWPERFPSGSDRARDAGAVMAAMHQATIVLHEHLSRRMGADVLAGLRRRDLLA